MSNNPRKNEFLNFPTQKIVIRLEYTYDKEALQLVSVNVKEELPGGGPMGVKDTENDPNKAIFHNLHFT
jgi:hypothetical protein